MKRQVAMFRLALLCVSVALTGCSQHPPRVLQPSLSPSSAASNAMAEFDSNGDGVLSGQELQAATGLNAAIKRFDKNGDGQLDEAEIEARLNEWVGSRIAIFAPAYIITLDGRPVAGANVQFEPEGFLGDAFQTVSAVTDEGGEVVPAKLEGYPVAGIPLGLYRMRISKLVDGKDIIPEKYNQNTTLGQEVAPGAEGMSTVKFFQLTSK